MKRTINFGKLDLYGTGRRCAAEITIELRERGGEATFNMVNGEKVYTGNTTPKYEELSICGTVWNSKKTDCIMGGQCLDSMAEYLGKNKTFKKLYTWWKAYHLNGMNAGTPEQKKAIKAWEAEGNRYEYTAVCDYLKQIGLYEVNFTGKTIGREYKNEPYKYGHAWIIEEIPADVLAEIRAFINNEPETTGEENTAA